MVLRQTRYNTGCSVDDFDTSKEGMSGIYTTVFDFMNNKGSSIHTGLQQLDNMLSGRGFEAGTVTLFLGVTGGWKSGMLLNCASWFTRYNANCQSFDATKIPCCIYYSLENSMVQTAQRWYAIRLGPTNEMTTKYANSSEVADALHELDQKECGGKVKVFFRYRKPRSTSADDIASEIEALKEEGYEPKMVILDYIKNMAPNDASITDERLRLGEIGNNIQSLAKEYKLALVTAQQINREGIKAVEGANELKKKDASKSIQASHAANSWDLIELMDMTIVLHCDYKIIEGVKTRIISLRKFKSRREQVSPVFFTHPFVEGRQMLLNEDIGKKCLSFDCCANDGDIQTDEEESPRRTKFKSQVEDPRAANRKAIAKFNKGRMGSSIDDEDDDDNGGGLLNGDEIL
jgi:KaiC/GvpD/RAD55 family RecA-like ATPase